MAPDGRSFVTAVALRQRALWVQHAGDERQVSSEGYSYDPKFAAGGKKLCYRILKGTNPWHDPSELWVLDLDSGRSGPLLPGMSLVGGTGVAYDVSADRREVVAGGLDWEGRHRLWLAPVDRSSAPEEIPGIEGDQPLFLKNGEILLHVGSVLHRVRRDGSGLERLMDEPSLYRGTPSPDNRWVLVRPIGLQGYFSELVSLQGEKPIVVAPAGAADFYLQWSPDRSWAFLSVSNSASSDRGWTYAVPLAHGRMLPEIPAEGFVSEAQIARLPGARRIESLDVVPGPVPGMYAFTRETLLRNLYRVPIQ